LVLTRLRGRREKQLLMTGNMLFEILDPFLLWKQIYLTIKSELVGEEKKEEERVDGAAKVRLFLMLPPRLREN
jgi:hypothetical protein